jgi:hypothetical protein
MLALRCYFLTYFSRSQTSMVIWAMQVANNPPTSIQTMSAERQALGLGPLVDFYQETDW